MRYDELIFHGIPDDHQAVMDGETRAVIGHIEVGPRGGVYVVTQDGIGRYVPKTTQFHLQRLIPGIDS